MNRGMLYTDPKKESDSKPAIYSGPPPHLVKQLEDAKKEADTAEKKENYVEAEKQVKKSLEALIDVFSYLDDVD